GTGAAYSGSSGVVITTPLTDGTHNITAVATDANGFSSPPSAALSITIDTIAPAAPSTPALSPAPVDPDGIIQSNVTPTFSGTAEAGTTVKIFDQYGATQTQIGSGTATGGNYSITTSALSTTAAPKPGEHSITATANDVAGNASTSGGLVLTVTGAVSAATIGTQSTGSSTS